MLLKKLKRCPMTTELLPCHTAEAIKLIESIANQYELMSYTSAGDPKRQDDMKQFAMTAGTLKRALDLLSARPAPSADAVPVNQPFERVPQHAYDPGYGPVSPEPKVVHLHECAVRSEDAVALADQILHQAHHFDSGGFKYAPDKAAALIEAFRRRVHGEAIEMAAKRVEEYSCDGMTANAVRSLTPLERKDSE